MSYRINGNTVISTGDGSLASANASFRNFFYRYGLNPATYPGTVGGSYGYITGGVGNIPAATQVPNIVPGGIRTNPSFFGSFTTSIQRFPFATSVNAVQVSGSLSTERTCFASQSSKTAGYNSGGYALLPPATPANNFFSNVTANGAIDSFPFASVGIISTTGVGNLSTARFSCSGHQSDLEGFTSGGVTSNTNTTGVSTIDKFPYSSFSTATSVGNLSGNRSGLAGHSSAVSGYTSGGNSPVNLILAAQVPQGTGTQVNTINRFPFSVSPVTASSVATLGLARGYVAGGSSITDGYVFGGITGTVNPATISSERFNFSEQTVTATSIANLSSGRHSYSVVNSSEYVYVCGGYTALPYQSSPGPSPSSVTSVPAPAISGTERFPFASSTIGADTTVNLTTALGNIGGNQY